MYNSSWDPKKKTPSTSQEIKTENLMTTCRHGKETIDDIRTPINGNNPEWDTTEGAAPQNQRDAKSATTAEKLHHDTKITQETTTESHKLPPRDINYPKEFAITGDISFSCKKTDTQIKIPARNFFFDHLGRKEDKKLKDYEKIEIPEESDPKNGDPAGIDDGELASKTSDTRSFSKRPRKTDKAQATIKTPLRNHIDVNTNHVSTSM